ncbi:MAG: VOC family protein [Chloroflexota bacterium]
MQIIPYLSFNGNCRVALTFYAELFGGTVGTFMNWNAEAIENIPGATVEHIMHGDITLNGFMIAGSDQFGDMYQPGGNISLMLDIDDLVDAQAKFAALAEEGQVMMPFAETFWADGYGFCTDRFGIQWQINCTGSKTM